MMSPAYPASSLQFNTALYCAGAEGVKFSLMPRCAASNAGIIWSCQIAKLSLRQLSIVGVISGAATVPATMSRPAKRRLVGFPHGRLPSFRIGFVSVCPSNGQRARQVRSACRAPARACCLTPQGTQSLRCHPFAPMHPALSGPTRSQSGKRSQLRARSIWRCQQVCVRIVGDADNNITPFGAATDLLGLICIFFFISGRTRIDRHAARHVKTNLIIRNSKSDCQFTGIGQGHQSRTSSGSVNEGTSTTNGSCQCLSTSTSINN